MDAHKFDNLVGIYEEDGTVRCRDCMRDEDWKDINQENIITAEDINEHDEWIYCDYCEKKL